MTDDSLTTTTPDGRTRPKVTGVLTSFNEEHNIADCIESMLWCDEIILVDSYSTDRTPEIAQRYDKVRFFQREYYGAGAQKNWALQHVRYDWVFLLDSDERCTPGLRREIESLLADGPEADAYMINRRVFFLGKQIKYSGWQRDQVSRLFRTGTAWYENRRVHSLLHTTGPTPLLKHEIDHHMVDLSFEEYAFRIARYAHWGAAQCWRDGLRARTFDLWVRPMWRFLRTYIFQLGVLDGQLGLVFCLLQAYGTYLKFAILWGWQTNAARGIEPNLPAFDDDGRTWEGLEELQQHGDNGGAPSSDGG